jgi:hypothetical protein
VRHEVGDVLAPVAQRGHDELKDREAVAEVGAETPGADQGVEVLVGGGDDADVYVQGGFVRAEASHCSARSATQRHGRCGR